MNPIDLIGAAERSVRKAIAGLEPDDWAIPVAGDWTAKDVLGHLSVSQARTADVLAAFAAGHPPERDPHDEEGSDFNQAQAAVRSDWAVDRVNAEYDEVQARLRQVAASVDPAAWPVVGAFSWYPRYSLDDLVAYRIYGHARNHATHLDLAAHLGRARRAR